MYIKNRGIKPRFTKEIIWPPSSIKAEDFALKIRRILSCHTTQTIVLTTQFQRLTSLCGIEASLQSPQRLAIEEGQVDIARRLLSDAHRSKVKGQLRKICVAVRAYPQSEHGEEMRILL